MPESLNLTFEIHGLDETKDAILRRLDEKRIQRALVLGGYRIERRAKGHDYCPVDTGRLRASHSTNWPNSGMAHGRVEFPAKANDGVTQPPKTPGTVAIIRSGTNVEYAAYVNLGTSRMAARPYALRAVLEELPQIEADIKYVIESGGKV